MTAAWQIADQINRALPSVKTGSLCVYGDFFGRPYDNMHSVLSARTSSSEDSLILDFDQGETLEVWEPQSALITPTAFAITAASRVRWTWFYYGRSQLPENQYFIEHLRSGDDVSVATDVDWAALEFSPSARRPAVQLL